MPRFAFAFCTRRLVAPSRTGDRSLGSRRRCIPATGWMAGCRLSLAGTSPAEPRPAARRTTTTLPRARITNAVTRLEGKGRGRRLQSAASTAVRLQGGDKGSMYVHCDVFASSVAYLELIRSTRANMNTRYSIYRYPSTFKIKRSRVKRTRFRRRFKCKLNVNSSETCIRNVQF